MYDNPLVNDADGFKLEHDALLNAFAIGHLLNRTVILPAFHCHQRRDAFFCKSNSQECSLKALYYVKTLDQYFPNAYREHVFLSHDLVPDSTRQSRSRINYIQTRLDTPSASERQSMRGYKPADVDQGATPAEIRQWFGDADEKVLVFHNLYEVFSPLTKPRKSLLHRLFRKLTGRRSLKDDVDSLHLWRVLKSCNYRQLPCAGYFKRFTPVAS